MMDRKRIAIITHYYGSLNYGGLLQAYALCRTLNDMGAQAEQIQYIHRGPLEMQQVPNWNWNRIVNGIKCRLSLVIEHEFHANMKSRSNAVSTFRLSIPHSEEVFSIDTISGCIEKYDIFVTGSDQVWNIDWYDEGWFLNFVSGKPKYSYAASLGTTTLSEEGKKIISKDLWDYSGISVRERDSVELLRPLVDQQVQCVLDPTLLLNKDNWNFVIPGRSVSIPYVFCYFLGDDDTERRLAKEYADKNRLLIVTFPHLGGRRRRCDEHFGDIKKYDATPLDFISLVKYAECVFTDSFHAAVFSNIYEKNFYVFGRAGSSGMSNRITTLCELFGNPERFCDSDERKTLPYLESIRDVRSDFTKLEEQREKSLAYLRGML